jgi:hypothetical protein
LYEFKNNYPHELSGGMRQRVGWMHLRHKQQIVLKQMCHTWKIKLYKYKKCVIFLKFDTFLFKSTIILFIQD